MLEDSEPRSLAAYLAARHADGLTVNVNQLGEALVGEQQAEARVASYCALAARPEVDAISVKVSSICSQLSVLAMDATNARLSQRLGAIYDAAGAHTLVYLDMEAYDELDLTAAAMQRALEPATRNRVRAGIVVQAYLPDSHEHLEKLLQFAAARVHAGGTPLTLRMVKGANLATERVHASLMGWAPPTYPDKASVDASFRSLLGRAMRPEHADCVRIGVGSHNVFDVAYALCLSESRDVREAVHIELLEGMADSLRRVLVQRGVPTLVYAPVVAEGSFQSAVAYLVRRLDENATDDNFLRRAFGMAPGNEAFALERARFREGVARMPGLSTTPRRDGAPYADRARPQQSPPSDRFSNEPNTDFSSAANRRWAASILTRQLQRPAPTLYSVVDGVADGERSEQGRDPSRPSHPPYQVTLASEAMLDHALRVAQRDHSGWATTPLAERARRVRAAAQLMREQRGELLGLMLSDAGKALGESDPEVSEAIDFAEYYCESALALERDTGGVLEARGVVLVASPWNFPLAIAAGGSFAALLAGNRVLLKPAPQSPWVASQFAALCWQAGIPHDALQLLLCDDEQAARLSRDRRVDAVVLTGSTATARAIRRARPDLRLSAETGGKNALIVSAISDREQAVHDAVLSAFTHAGQKCSATSLLICEAEVYDEPGFLDLLADAAASLAVGSAYEPQSVVTPLIEAPSAHLLRGLTQLEPGERWLLEPRCHGDNPLLWSPGVRCDVAPGSFSHMHELFGPVLSVLRARDLAHAVELAQQPGYGLTAGLHSLDERQQRWFAHHMRAGNLYINRTTTGAIVRRQPFGGERLSSFGPGAKAGGPNYVLSMGRLALPAPSTSTPASDWPYPGTPSQAARDRFAQRQRDYVAWWDKLACPVDPSNLLGEANWFRSLPCESVILRVGADADLLDLASSCWAAKLTACAATLSFTEDAAARLQPAGWGLPHMVEDDEQAWHPASPATRRVRCLGEASPALHAWAAHHDVHVITDPVSDSGRVELLHYLREQSLSVRYHRHGHLGSERLRERLLDGPAKH